MVPGEKFSTTSVGLGDQLLGRLQTRRGLQVEDDGPLVAVDRQEVGAQAVEVVAGPGADVVAEAGRFDLDDVGAHVGEHHGAVGRGPGVLEGDDLDAVERSRDAGRCRVSSVMTGSGTG